MKINRDFHDKVQFGDPENILSLIKLYTQVTNPTKYVRSSTFQPIKC